MNFKGIKTATNHKSDNPEMLYNIQGQKTTYTNMLLRVGTGSYSYFLAGTFQISVP